MGKLGDIINGLIQRIKNLVPKKNEFEIMALNEPIKDSTDRNKAFRRGQVSEKTDTTPTFYSEIANARAKVNELIAGELEEKESIEGLYSKLFIKRFKTTGDKVLDSIYTGINVPTIMKVMTESISDCILREYEIDSQILETQNREGLIRKIKESRTGESAQLNEEYFKEIIEKHFTKTEDGNIKEYGISEDEFLDNILTYLLESEISNRKKNQMVAEEAGLNYALLNSISDKVELPEELREKFESREDYIKKEKARIQDAIGNLIGIGSKTPSEEKALKSIMEKVLEKNGVEGDVNLNLDIIRSLIKEDIQNGDVNPGLPRYTQDVVNEVLRTIIKGADQISPNNRENTKFMYFDEDREGPYNTVFYEGKIPEKDIVQE